MEDSLRFCLLGYPNPQPYKRCLFHQTQSFSAPDLDPEPQSLNAVLLQWLAQFGDFALGWETLLICGLLLLSAFSSAMEAALLSISPTDRAKMNAAASPIFKPILYLLTHLGEALLTLSSFKTAINIALVVLTAWMTNYLAGVFGWHPLGAFFIEIGVLCFLLLIVANIIPKLLVQSRALAFSQTAALPLSWGVKAFLPITKQFANVSTRLNERMKPAEEGLSLNDLKFLADLGQRHGTLQDLEREMIYSIADFSETTVKEVMVSRMDIVAIPVTACLSEGLAIIREHGYSRYPLYEDHLDHILGLVYAKDLLPLIGIQDPDYKIDWLAYCRPQPMYVPETKYIRDLLEEFKAKRTHMAIVIDEHGGTEGIVTMENVLEEIVGDIWDELDDEEEEKQHQLLDDGAYLIEGRMHLDDLNELLGTQIEAEDDSFHTVAGFILQIAEEIPAEGSVWQHGTLEFTVHQVEQHRIAAVKVRVLT